MNNTITNLTANYNLNTAEGIVAATLAVAAEDQSPNRGWTHEDWDRLSQARIDLFNRDRAAYCLLKLEEVKQLLQVPNLVVKQGEFLDLLPAEEADQTDFFLVPERQEADEALFRNLWRSMEGNLCSGRPR